MNPQPISIQIPRKTSVPLQASATQQDSLPLHVLNAKSTLQSHFQPEFFNLPDGQEGMFDGSITFVCFLSSGISHSVGKEKQVLHSSSTLGVLSPFFQFIHSCISCVSHTCGCLRSRYSSLPHR